MRGYRLFPKQTTSVAVEFRIQGFRIRTIHMVIGFIGAFAALASVTVSLWLAGIIGAFVFVVTVGLAVYIYRTDPQLVLGETTLFALLWSGARNRYTNNETQED